MLTRDRIDRFYQDVKSLNLKFPVVETIIDKIWLPYIIDFLDDFRIEIKPMGDPWSHKVRLVIDKSEMF